MTRASYWALAALLCLLGALLHAPRALGRTRAAVVALAARDEAGQPVSALHAGERLVVHGTLTPAVVGAAIPVTVALDGQPLAALTAHVDAVGPDGTGTFEASLRPTHAGLVSVTAAAAGTAPATVAVAVTAVGHVEPGCAASVTLTRERLARPPLAGDGPLRPGALLWPGARVLVLSRGAIRLRRGRTAYRSRGAKLVVECRALKLLRGGLRALHRRRGRARVLLGDALASVVGAGRLDVDARHRRLRFARGRGLVTTSADPRSVMHTIAGDTVLLERRGLARMDTWPFAKSPEQRRLPRGAVPPYWADGWPCATGCRPPVALTGWPLKPFHAAHPLRSGLNEWRPANMHIGVDIQARDGTPVYAVQSGRASIAGTGTVDVRVGVGSYEYWHVRPRVVAGQYVRAHRTVIGRIIRGAGHLHFSERRGDYLNPLRPGGRVLVPYHDAEEPVIGPPRRSGGQVVVEAFDPQSLRETTRYRTPVLAPAAVAWRARDAHGRALTALTFAYRGSHHYPASARSQVYAPGTRPPSHAGASGWACFWRFAVCVPRWDYRLAGVPAAAASLSVYAWDWAGNVAVRSSALTPHPARAARVEPPSVSLID
jgi:hypothetical protein